MRRFSWLDWLVFGLALVAIAAGFWPLLHAEDGLEVRTAVVGETPVTVYARSGAGPAPAVVIAHGFAGSQGLMQPFALSLARNGYTAVTFDFIGHGQHPEPIRGDVTTGERVLVDMLGQLAAVSDFARALSSSDGRLAVLGHSMASDLVVRFAQAPGDAVAATVAVSMFAPTLEPASPRNLLVIVGGWEPGVLRDEGLRAVELTGFGPAEEGVTVGDFAAGTARRVAFADGVEHVGVLYARESMAEAVAWYDAVFDRAGDGALEARGPALGLLFLGLVALARPLARLLPVVTVPAAGGSPGWRRLWLLALGPAALTPLVLFLLPTDFLPLLLGDYLVVHFAVYGALTGLGLWWLGVRSPAGFTACGKGLAAALAIAAYAILVLGLPIDRFVTNFVPTLDRLALVPALLLGTVPYFLADEWLTRGPEARRGAYALTKLAFVISLGIAIALDPERLFFLAIIAPVILIFFTVYGLFSAWAWRRTGHPWVGALANALALAWAIAATFPLIA